MCSGCVFYRILESITPISADRIQMFLAGNSFSLGSNEVAPFVLSARRCWKMRLLAPFAFLLKFDCLRSSRERFWRREKGQNCRTFVHTVNVASHCERRGEAINCDQVGWVEEVRFYLQIYLHHSFQDGTRHSLIVTRQAFSEAIRMVIYRLAQVPCYDMFHR